ncbi:unnamed protein product [Amoebophrya sp. A25]|nr:unnamed protein product [Amoebophrya sp. A25]|eukprot:GSA25T00002997001.1
MGNFTASGVESSFAHMGKCCGSDTSYLYHERDNEIDDHRGGGARYSTSGSSSVTLGLNRSAIISSSGGGSRHQGGQESTSSGPRSAGKKKNYHQGSSNEQQASSSPSSGRMVSSPVLLAYTEPPSSSSSSSTAVDPEDSLSYTGTSVDQLHQLQLHQKSSTSNPYDDWRVLTQVLEEEEDIFGLNNLLQSMHGMKEARTVNLLNARNHKAKQASGASGAGSSSSSTSGSTSTAAGASTVSSLFMKNMKNNDKKNEDSSTASSSSSSTAATAQQPQAFQPFRTLHFEYVLERGSEPERLGIDVDHIDEGTALRIERVQESGLVGRWNHRHNAGERIFAGDKVLSVNGVQGNAQAMIAECQKVEKPSLRFEVSRTVLVESRKRNSEEQLKSEEEDLARHRQQLNAC